MNNFQISLMKRVAWLVCLSLMISAGATELAAADPKLEVQLVWGTNDESSSNPNHKPLEASLVKKLAMFKWKNYFTVTNKEVSLPEDAKQKIRLSKQCEIELKHLDGEKYEINLFGKGKHVQKSVRKLSKGEAFAFAGDDKNDCAWLVLIRKL